MTTSRRARWHSVALLIVFACSCVVTLAHGRTPQPTTAQQFKCYCQCEGQDGMTSCPKKMCELPKYENRWWAVSCHRRAAVPSVSEEPSAQPSGRHTSSILNASANTDRPATQPHN